MAGVAIATAAVMTSTPPAAMRSPIQRLYAEEKRRNRLTEAGRGQQPNRSSESNNSPDAGKHEPDDARWCRAERNADTKLPRPLLHRVREHAEYADHGKQKRQRSERPDQKGAKSISLGGGARHALERRDVVRGLTWVHFRDGRAHGRGEHCRVAGRYADDEL